MTDSDAALTIAPDDLAERIRVGESVTVLDVRDRDEFEAWRVGGPGVEIAQVPHAKLLQAQVRGGVSDLVADALGAVPDEDDGPIVVVCGRGEASAHVAGLLTDAGVPAANLADGMRGWARVYLAAEIAGGRTGTDATVLQYRRPSSGCLAYLVVSGGEAAVIDPLRTFAGRYAADAADRGAALRYAVDTHVHADHVSGTRAVADATGATPVASAGAENRGLAYDVRTVEDGDDLRVGDATLTALATPGHTTEMTSFRLGEVLFCGDTVFPTGVARPDLEAADDEAADAAEVGGDGAMGNDDEGADDAVEEMARTLHRTIRERILSLPDETLVAPGHYGDDAAPADDGTYTATLGELRERVEALSWDESAFVERVRAGAADRDRPANHERIVAANLGRDDVDDGDAFELELGPNNCAATGAAD